MTTGNNMPLSNGDSASATPSASAIAAVNGVARQLYRRARTAGPEFADVAAEVRNLHRVLKHLCVEAEDPDSPLNHDAAAAPGSTETVYARRLTPVLEDTDFTLKQLETMLAKYGSGGESAEEGATGRASSPIIEIEGRERDMLARIQSKLAVCKTEIDIFLDTIQLHHPARARQNLDNTDGHQLDAIKDKVDAIARRLFSRRGSGSSDNDEELWVQFRSELERAGFSSEVLRKNKEVLRAYIRELDLRGYLEAEEPPTVRGMLNHQPRNGPPMMITPSSYPGPQHHGGLMPDGYPANSQQYSQELQPRHAHSYQPPPMFPQGSSGLSYEPYSSSSSDSESSDSTGSSQLALISTRDLIILDRKEVDAFNARLAAMHLSPQHQLPPPSNYSISPGTSPNGRYLPAPPQPIPIQAPPTSMPALPPQHQLSSSPGSQQLLGVSPRYVPPVLVPGYGGPGGPQLLPPPGGLSPSSSVLTPPPAYGSSPTTAGALIAPQPRQQYARLQPDSTGKDIPLDATWTKIKRTLVSTEVLERAGVRYEARPEFVAVLGVLSREQIAEYARQSELVRQARRRGGGRSRGANGHHRRGERGSDGRRQYPVRHPAPSDDKKRDGSSSGRRKQDSGSDSDVLWDESDTTDDEHPSRRRRRGGSGRSSDKRANGTGTGSSAQARYTPKTYIDPSAEAKDSSDDKGSRFIVNPPSMAAAAAAGAGVAAMSGALSGSEGKTSPSSTVLPKPILKNKNENHVRFDEDGPKEISQDELRRERERESRRRRGDGKDKDGQNRDRKDRDGRRRHHHHHSHHRDGSGSQGAGSTSTQRQKDRAIKKSVWGETLGAVGIGGAAASLLSVLTEAAAGF